MSTLVLVMAACIVVVGAHLAILARNTRFLRKQFERELEAARDSAARRAYTRSSATATSGNGHCEELEAGKLNEQELSADTIAAIEASIAAITGKGVHVRAARGEVETRPDNTRWAGVGRITIQHSHEIARNVHPSPLTSKAVVAHEITTSEAA